MTGDEQLIELLLCSAPEFRPFLRKGGGKEGKTRA